MVASCIVSLLELGKGGGFVYGIFIGFGEGGGFVYGIFIEVGNGGGFVYGIFIGVGVGWWLRVCYSTSLPYYSIKSSDNQVPKCGTMECYLFAPTHRRNKNISQAQPYRRFTDQ